MTSVLVGCASRHGFTQGIAERIAAKLGESGLTAELRPLTSPGDLSGYDAFVLGRSVYMGSWLKPATDFLRRNHALLAARPVWLFSSGPLGTSATDAKGRDLITVSEPKQYAEFRTSLSPRGLKVFFGGLDPNRLRSAERLLRSLPAGRQLMPEGDFRDWEQIDSWAEGIARELSAVSAPGR